MSGSTHQLDDHELLADLRQPLALRRPRRRPPRSPPHVPHRTRHLHRLVLRCRRWRQAPRRCSPLARARGSAPRSSPRRHSRSSPPAFHGAQLARRRSPPGAQSAERAQQSASSSAASSPSSPTGGRSSTSTCPSPPSCSSPRSRSSRPTRRSRAGAASTFAGAALATTSLAAIVYGITQANSAGWTSIQTHVCGLGGLAGPRSRSPIYELPHRQAAPARRADRRPRRRWRTRAHARRRRLDLRIVPALLALPPERARLGAAHHRPRVHPACRFGRYRRARRRSRRSPSTASAARSQERSPSRRSACSCSPASARRQLPDRCPARAC